jgi:hypothetical protein
MKPEDKVIADKTNDPPTLDKNNTAALLLKKAAKTLSFAKVELVKMRIAGEVVDETLSDTDAMKMVQTAADEYFTPAEYLLATISQEGLLGQTKNPKQSVKYLERAALRGHKDASYELGLLYLDGLSGVKQDTNKAIKLLTIAAREEKGVVEFDYTIEDQEDAKIQLDQINRALKEVAVRKTPEEEELSEEEAPEEEEAQEEAPEEEELPEEKNDDIYIVAADEAARFLEGKYDEYGHEEKATIDSAKVDIIDVPDDSPSEPVSVDDIDVGFDDDKPSASAAAVVAASAAAAPEPAAAPDQAAPALPLMSDNDIETYQTAITNIRTFIDEINHRRTTYKEASNKRKNEKIQDILQAITNIEDIIATIAQEQYPTRSSLNNLNVLNKLNARYQELTNQYENLKPILTEFVKNHRVATGKLVMDHKTSELFLVPEGEGEGEVPSPSPSGKAAEADVGGSHRGGGRGGSSIQKGGRYRIPHDSKIYRMFATEVGHKPSELNKTHPEIYEKVFKGIESGEIKLIEDDEPPIKSSDNSKSEAYLTARDSNVVRNMLRGLTQRSVSAMKTTTDELIKEYDQLVAMCRPETAVALIKAQLESKNIDLPKEPLSKVKATDKRIRETLGWNNNNENTLLYDVNLVRKTATPTANGVFSKFCYHKGKFSVFMSRGCPGDYSCMLNWIIIFAFRLLTREPEKYKDENIVELIQNLHKTLFGDIFAGSSYFVGLFVSDEKNTTFYAESVKKLLSSDILNDNTLGPLVLGIKEEIQKMPEPAIDSRVRKTTERLRGGMRDIVTRKHRDNRVEDTAKYTRKHKIVTISLNKTRRTKT